MWQVLTSIWPWRSKSITPLNNKNLKQSILQLCNSKIWWSWLEWVTSHHMDKVKVDAWTYVQVDEQMDRHTDRHRQYLKAKTGLGLARQIWGIWKLRPAYSPETPNLGQNQWCFVPCDLESWWMTLENIRASLLCCFKLCATFHSHRWIQAGVTVRKCPIWVKFNYF